MEMHLFNAAKPLRMERTYKAFFINLKIPVGLLTTESLDDKGLKHISLLFRNFKLNNRDTLSLCPSDPNRISRSSSSGSPGTLNDQNQIAKDQMDLLKGESASIMTSRGPSANTSPNNGSRKKARCCQMDYSLYDVEAGSIESFTNINHIHLCMFKNGTLELASEQSIDEPCVEIFLLLALKKIAVSDPSHRELLNEAVGKAIISKLQSAFHTPLQRILHTSALKLNGPLIFSAVSRSLASAHSIRRSVVYSH